MGGWTDEQIRSLRARAAVGGNRIDALIGLVREADANSGTVAATTWRHAQNAGWGDEQLAEAFGYLGLTVFTAYFLNYVRTDVDV